MRLSQYVSVLTGLMLFIMSAFVDKCDKDSHSESPCTLNATARDFTGLDGCGILFVLESEEKLLAINIDDYQPPLKNGEHVRISFAPDDVMSVCMAEDVVGRITCMARLDGKQWVADCPTMIDPYRVEWAAQVMQEINPRQVEELDLDGQRAYRFYAPSGARIYNCRGELLCSYTYQTPHGCDEVTKKTNDVKVIYVVNE